jgi:hypothetical protein
MKGVKATLFFFFLMGIGHALMMVINRVDERYGFEMTFMFWSALVLTLCGVILIYITRFNKTDTHSVESFSFISLDLTRPILGKV